MVRIQKKIRYKGVTSVEAAIVFPLLLVLTFGVIEYGWLFLKAQQITNATRYGARLAILQSATRAGVEAAVINLLTSGGIQVASIEDIDIANISAAPGSPVTVQVTVPCDQNLLIMNIPFLPKPATVGALVTMSKEGPSM